MRMLFLIAILSVNSFGKESAQLVPKWGFEKNIVTVGTGSGERLWGVEYIHPIKSKMKLKAELGTWLARQDGRKSSAYASISWGYRIETMLGFFLSVYTGPGWIQKTDSRLGGHFQIFHDVNIGFIDEGWGIGLGFKHISSAGIYSPNYGRDFVGMRFLINL